MSEGTETKSAAIDKDNKDGTAMPSSVPDAVDFEKKSIRWWIKWISETLSPDQAAAFIRVVFKILAAIVTTTFGAGFFIGKVLDSANSLSISERILAGEHVFVVFFDSMKETCSQPSDRSLLGDIYGGGSYEVYYTKPGVYHAVGPNQAKEKCPVELFETGVTERDLTDQTKFCYPEKMQLCIWNFHFAFDASGFVTRTDNQQVVGYLSFRPKSNTRQTNI